jgi:hypothetical protein
MIKNYQDKNKMIHSNINSPKGEESSGEKNYVL